MAIRKISFAFVVATFLVTACSQDLTPQEYIKKGQEHVLKKEWNAAIIEFKNAVKQSPDNAEARASLGKAYVENSNPLAAIKELNRAVELGYDKQELLLPLAKAYRLANDQQKIIDEISVAGGLDANEQADLYAMRAIVYFRLNNKAEALKALQQARKLDESSTEVRLAWAIYENNNPRAQREWLAPLLERDGGIAQAWSLLGEIEQNANHLEAAERAYSRSIALRDYGHVDSARRALIRVSLDNMEGAREDVRELRKKGATWPVVDHIEGLIAFQENRIDEARSHFLDALSKAPDYMPSKLFLGIINYQNNNLSNAASYLEQYIALRPDENRANFIYASVLLKQGKAVEAEKILTRLNEQDRENTDVLSLLANAYLINKEPARAIAVLKKAIAIEPDKAPTRLQLGSVLLGNSSTLKAGQQELVKALEIDPQLIQADKTLFMSYLREKRYQDARAIAQRVNQKHKDLSEGANLMALAYLVEGKTPQAESQLAITLQRFPADMTATELLARIYLSRNEAEKARALFENVLKENPASLKAMNRLAQLSAREGDTDQVLEWLKKAQQSNPDQLAPKLVLANHYLSRNQPRQAVDLLNEFNDDQKQLPGYMILMAQAKMATGEYQHAVRLLKTLISSQPNAASAHFLLAQVYARENNPELMRSSLENAIKLNPDYIAAQVVLARLDLQEGKADDFKKRVSTLDQKYPENNDVQLLKAKIESSDKNYGQAIDTLAKLMQQTPRSEVALDLSRNLWAAGDKAGAIQGLEIWSQGNPDDSAILMLLAQFYLADNQLLKAKETYAGLDRQLPDNPLVLNNLAWLMKDSDTAKAITYASKALELKPESPFIKDTLAMLYLQNGDKVKALKLSEEASQAAPGLLDVQLNYATILAANNKQPQARKMLNNLRSKAKLPGQKQLIKEAIEKL